MLSHTNWKQRKKGRGRFAFQGACCSETGWALVCLWKVVSDSPYVTSLLLSFCSTAFVLTHKLSCAFSLLQSPCCWGRGGWESSKQLCGCMAAAWDQPRHIWDAGTHLCLKPAFQQHGICHRSSWKYGFGLKPWQAFLHIAVWIRKV